MSERMQALQAYYRLVLALENRLQRPFRSYDASGVIGTHRNVLACERARKDRDDEERWAISNVAKAGELAVRLEREPSEAVARELLRWVEGSPT